MRSLPLFCRPFAALGAASLLALTGCATVGEPLPDDAFVGENGLYELELGQSFRPARADSSVFDRVYRDREGSIFVGVVVDGPAVSLDELDASVAANLGNGPYDEARITEVTTGELGGLEARESRIHLVVDGRPFTMINVHTATAQQNVQLVVWGTASRAHLIDSLVRELSTGGFRFLREITPFGGAAPDLEELPVRFAELPGGWRTTPKGALNAEAAIELSHPDGRYLIGMIEQRGEVPFPAMRSVLQENLSGILLPRGDETTAPYAVDGAAPDVSWTQSGLLSDDEVGVTYRVRLVEEEGRFLHLYCWGESEQERLVEDCDELLDGVTLR